MLASDGAFLGDEYDVVIVGTGYGGAITAARLGFGNARSGRGLRIAALERGDEHVVGSFPDRDTEFFDQVREPTSRPLGLYEYLAYPTIDVVQGCGLGGTSLINANVAIVPDQEVFQSSWPQAIRDEAAQGQFFRYFERARTMLGASPFTDTEPLKKAPVFRQMASTIGGPASDLSIAVSKVDRITRYGVVRKKCISCGDCVTGCNVGAKSTLAMNYLPMARFFGVELFVRIEVQRIEKLAAGYRLVCMQRTGPRGFFSSSRVLKAKHVILAAGSLGTTGILLRSRETGLSVSPKLGHNFSGNGDFISIAYNADRITDFQGSGVDSGPRSRVKAGPTIAVVVRTQDPDFKKRLTVEDLSCPRALVDAFRKTLLAFAPFIDINTINEPDELRRWRADIVWNDTGAANSTIGFLVMGHDNSEGRIVLTSSGRVTVDWPNAPTEVLYEEINSRLRNASAVIGGTYIPNPRWHNRLLGNNLITAHPLGGCASSDAGDTGVVDHLGRVFAYDGGVHEGLYVADGSVIPRALGVNPFLTISAFAERVADHLRAKLNLTPFDASAEADDV